MYLVLSTLTSSPISLVAATKASAFSFRVCMLYIVLTIFSITLPYCCYFLLAANCCILLFYGGWYEDRHLEAFFRCCIHRLSTFTFFALMDFPESVYFFCDNAVFALMENGWKVVTAFPFQLNSYNPPITYR